MIEVITGVPPDILELDVWYEIVPAHEFTREENELACKAFSSSNPIHLERGVVPGNLLTGWITERLLGWAQACPQFSGERQVVLNQMSVTFLRLVWVNRPMRLVASITSMTPEHLELRVRLEQVDGISRVMLMGNFGGGLIRSGA